MARIEEETNLPYLRDRLADATRRLNAAKGPTNAQTAMRAVRRYERQIARLEAEESCSQP